MRFDEESSSYLRSLLSTFFRSAMTLPSVPNAQGSLNRFGKDCAAIFQLGKAAPARGAGKAMQELWKSSKSSLSGNMMRVQISSHCRQSSHEQSGKPRYGCVYAYMCNAVSGGKV